MNESKMLNELKSVLAAMGVQVRVVDLSEGNQPPAQEEQRREEPNQAATFAKELFSMLVGEKTPTVSNALTEVDVDQFIEFLKNELGLGQPAEEKQRGKFEIGDVVVYQGELGDVYDITTTSKGKTRLHLLRMDGSTVKKVRPRELDAECKKEFVGGVPYILNNRVFAFTQIGDGEIPAESLKVTDGVFVTEESAGGDTPWAFKGLFSSAETMHKLVRMGALKPISVVQWNAMPTSDKQECNCGECQKKNDGAGTIQVGDRVIYPTRGDAAGVVISEEFDEKFQQRRLKVRLDAGITLSNLESYFFKE